MEIQAMYLPQGASTYSSAAAEETAQIKASPGNLYGLIISNFNAAARFAYVFDNASADSGTLVLPPVPIGINAMVVVPLPFALLFVNGLRVHSSSTGPTFTASAANDFRIWAAFK